MNSEEIPWLELCTPSFVICPDCFFSLGFRSSETRGFICLQTFLFFSRSDLMLVPDMETQPIHGEHRSASVSKWKHCVSFLQPSSFPWCTLPLFHPDVSGRPEAPKDGALGFSQEIMVGSWKLGLQSKKEFFVVVVPWKVVILPLVS